MPLPLTSPPALGIRLCSQTLNRTSAGVETCTPSWRLRIDTSKATEGSIDQNVNGRTSGVRSLQLCVH